MADRPESWYLDLALIDRVATSRSAGQRFVGAELALAASPNVGEEEVPKFDLRSRRGD